MPVSRYDAGVNDRAKMRLGSGHDPHQVLLVCEGNRVRLGGRATKIQIALAERAGEVVTARVLSRLPGRADYCLIHSN